MSFFDALFRRKPANYGYPRSHDPDYDYYAGLRPSEQDEQAMLAVAYEQKDMPPLADTKTSNETVEDANTSSPVSACEPIDAEAAAYEAWAKDNKKDDVGSERPVVTSSTVPTAPNIPKRPDVQPLSHTKGLQSSNEPFGPKPQVWLPTRVRIPEKEVLAFIVENSKQTLKYKEEIVNIISQTVERKKNAIFLFVRVGNGQQAFTPMNYYDVIEDKVVSSLITASSSDDVPDIAKALFYLSNNLKAFSSDSFTFDKTKYKLETCSVVCIGTGACILDENSKQIISSCISKLQSTPKLKAFKYFCVKDSDSVRVSALGFPVIGHIVSNYYE